MEFPTGVLCFEELAAYYQEKFIIYKHLMSGEDILIVD